jgi:acetylxylan esterase
MYYSLKGISLFLLAKTVASSPVGQLQERACPGIHVFGARETTVSPGYGSAGTVVNLILNSHSGSTSEAINYPACGGQSSCGSVSYANSVIQGINAVVSQVNSFNAQCPSTQLVLVGYSQVSKPLDSSMFLPYQELWVGEITWR